jgi:protein SCO1/2
LADEPYEFVGTVLSDPDIAPSFTLTADTGERVGIDSYRGKVVLIYFGYTFCPDICPASLAELAEAVTLLGDDGSEVQVIMISVDPARDKPEVLGQYVDFFDPTFVGLTGTEAEIADVADKYNVFYEAQQGTPATDYLVDHWAGVMLIDRDGMLAELFSNGTTGEQIAADTGKWL